MKINRRALVTFSTLGSLAFAVVAHASSGPQFSVSCTSSPKWYSLDQQPAPKVYGPYLMSSGDSVMLELTEFEDKMVPQLTLSISEVSGSDQYRFKINIDNWNHLQTSDSNTYKIETYRATVEDKARFVDFQADQLEMDSSENKLLTTQWSGVRFRQMRENSVGRFFEKNLGAVKIVGSTALKCEVSQSF